MAEVGLDVLAPNASRTSMDERNTEPCHFAFSNYHEGLGDDQSRGQCTQCMTGQPSLLLVRTFDPPADSRSIAMLEQGSSSGDDGDGDGDGGGGGNMPKPGSQRVPEDQQEEGDDDEPAQAGLPSTYSGELPPNTLPPLPCTGNPWGCNCSRVCRCEEEWKKEEWKEKPPTRWQLEKMEGLLPGYKCSCVRFQCDCNMDADCDKPYAGDYMLSYEGGLVEVPFNSLYNFKDLAAFTFEMWLRLPENDPNPNVVKCVMSRFNYGKAGQFRMWTKGGSLFFQRENMDNTPRILGSPPLPTNQWVHVAIVYTGKTLVMLVNGNIAAMRRSPEAYDDTKTPLVLGACMAQDKFVRPFNGVIDDVRIWNVARTQAEIQKRMFERLFPADEILDGLVGYWRCNLGHGKVIADRSKAHQHATIRGKVVWHESTVPISKRQEDASSFIVKTEKMDCGLPPKCQPSGNLALNKQTRQSGTGWGGVSSRGVDGYPKPRYGDRHCTHTTHQHSPWWQVDLGMRVDVNRVRVLNRADCCASRLNGVAVMVGDSYERWQDNTLCKQMDTVCSGSNCWVDMECGGTITGRYVFVVIPGRKEYLTLCEVEVYGPDVGPRACKDDVPRSGSVTIKKWGGGTKCQDVAIMPPFLSGVPMVQVTPSHRDHKPSSRPHEAVVTWLEGITRASFKVCIRETSQSGSGAHAAMGIEWFAFSQGTVAGGQSGEVPFPPFEGISCQRISFAPAFSLPPYLQITANHRVVENPSIPMIDFGGAIGGGWQLVRRVQRGYNWHPAVDQLAGVQVYGTYTPDYTAHATFSIDWSNMDFSEFLFATGDMQKWAIVHKAQIYNRKGGPYRGRITASSLRNRGYFAYWYKRDGVREDPWISLRDHFPSIGSGDIVYGGYGWGGLHAATVLPKHNGANVFIRKAGIHDATTSWVQDITTSMARVCVRETAHHGTGAHDGSLRVGWLALEKDKPVFSKHFLIATGAVSLPPFHNKYDGSSPCFYVQNYRKDMLDATEPLKILATINHRNRPGATHQAITKWTEEITHERTRVCVRELSHLLSPGGNRHGPHDAIVVDWMVFAPLPPKPLYLRWLPGPSTDKTAAEQCNAMGSFWGRCSYEQLYRAEELGYRKCFWSRFARPYWDVAICGDCGLYKKRPGECQMETLRTTPRPSEGSGVFCCHLSCE